MKVYLASSWKNQDLDALSAGLTALGHEVYDFRAQPGTFNWGTELSGVDVSRLSGEQVMAALRRPKAKEQFALDLAALDSCDAMVLVLPSGRSAHLEAGYFRGRFKPVFTLFAPNDGIDLMHLMLGGESFRATTGEGACALLDAYARTHP